MLLRPKRTTHKICWQLRKDLFVCIYTLSHTQIYGLFFAIGHAKKRKVFAVSNIDINSEEEYNDHLEEKKEDKELELEDSEEVIL